MNCPRPYGGLRRKDAEEVERYVVVVVGVGGNGGNGNSNSSTGRVASREGEERLPDDSTMAYVQLIARRPLVASPQSARHQLLCCCRALYLPRCSGRCAAAFRFAAAEEVIF